MAVASWRDKESHDTEHSLNSSLDQLAILLLIATRTRTRTAVETYLSVRVSASNYNTKHDGRVSLPFVNAKLEWSSSTSHGHGHNICTWPMHCIYKFREERQVTSRFWSGQSISCGILPIDDADLAKDTVMTYIRSFTERAPCRPSKQLLLM
jgi:hypothetical protein